MVLCNSVPCSPSEPISQNLQWRALTSLTCCLPWAKQWIFLGKFHLFRFQTENFREDQTESRAKCSAPLTSNTVSDLFWTANHKVLSHETKHWVVTIIAIFISSCRQLSTPNSPSQLLSSDKHLLGTLGATPEWHQNMWHFRWWHQNVSYGLGKNGHPWASMGIPKKTNRTSKVTLTCVELHKRLVREWTCPQPHRCFTFSLQRERRRRLARARSDSSTSGSIFHRGRKWTTKERRPLAGTHLEFYGPLMSCCQLREAKPQVWRFGEHRWSPVGTQKRTTRLLLSTLQLDIAHPSEKSIWHITWIGIIGMLCPIDYG